MEVADQQDVWLSLATPSTWPFALNLDAGWRPLAGIASARDDVCEGIAGRLGGCPPRVAWSTMLLGLSARLWGALLPSCLSGILVDPGSLSFRHDQGALQLGGNRPTGWTGATVDDLHAVVLDALTPLVDAIPLAPRLLWGNVASALAAAPRVLELPAATDTVTDLLARTPYRGEIVHGRRTTCCLFYLVPGAGLCADCVLDRIPAR